MAKQDLEEKTVRELRTMAKRAGIAVKGDWKKADLVKVLSLKKKPAVKPAKPAKKTPPRKTEDKKSIAHKAAGNQIIKKPVKRTQAAKAKSVSLKALPKKAPLPDFVSVALKPPPELVLTPLPAEYSGDKIVSMQVNPGRIYVYWEVAEDRLVKYKGSLNLKVVDTKDNYFFYTPVSGRIGESFININPDSDYAVEIGVIDYKGEFVNIMQPESTAVTEVYSETPASGQSEMTGHAQRGEVALPEEFFEVPDPVGSH
ncbi:MAG: DUF4912 domain-containing protein [Dissulfurispiraceae bacterium]